jgi:hypothetical protein
LQQLGDPIYGSDNRGRDKADQQPRENH